MKESRRQSYLLGMRIIGDFSAAIAVPVILLVLLGKWLQTRYGFAPFGVIGGFVLAALISGFSIYRKAQWYACEYKSIPPAQCKKL